MIEKANLIARASLVVPIVDADDFYAELLGLSAAIQVRYVWSEEGPLHRGQPRGSA